MMHALICSQEDLGRDLGDTVLWRQNVARQVASTVAQAHKLAAERRPDIVLIDHRFPAAAGAVAALRQSPQTRNTSIVALARGDFDPAELDLLEAGANAILRLPPGSDWDDRLVRLIHIPMRRAFRFPMHLQVDDAFRSSGEVFDVVALNLSVNGLLIESSKALAVGEDVNFAFHLPQEAGLVTGSGTVVRQASGIGQFGVELTHVEGDGRVRIKRFVEGLGASAAAV